MNLKFYIILLAIFYSCSSKEVYKLEEVQLGMTVKEVLEQLPINDSSFIFIQEPPFIYRGITVVLKDSTAVEILFERTSADINDLSNKRGLEITSELEITGFFWKKKNGESNKLGQGLNFWTEEEIIVY